MRINEIEVFDLFGDGTLVLKTNTDEESKTARYAWYVYYQGRLIHKTPYQAKSFLGVKVEKLGRYTVKAFVKDEDEKIKDEIEVVLNRTTSPVLANNNKTVTLITIIVEKVTSNIMRFDVQGDFDENTTFAWYIYSEGNDEPICKQMYAKTSEYFHTFNTTGKYYAKVFALSNTEKRSVKSDVFSIEVNN